MLGPINLHFKIAILAIIIIIYFKAHKLKICGTLDTEDFFFEQYLFETSHVNDHEYHQYDKISCQLNGQL